MAEDALRDTNIETALFPVELRNIFFEEPRVTGTIKVPIPGYRAIVDAKSKKTFSVVSDGYRLVTNREALEFGKQAFNQFFDTVNTDDMEIFNVIKPHTRSYCHIDLIHKKYEVNVWKTEVFLPYIRVTNSYNRSRALRFDLGFVRKLCDNGVIFERQAISFKFDHTRQVIKDKIDFKGQYGKLKALEQQFVNYMTGIKDIQVPRLHALPLMVKALDMKFDTTSNDEKKKLNAEQRLDEFHGPASRLVNRYYRELGENAYSVYNAATDYASAPPRTGGVNLVNGLQKRVGNWVEEFTSQQQPINFDEYLAEQSTYFTKAVIAR
jgi:hypothetical protein